MSAAYVYDSKSRNNGAKRPLPKFSNTLKYITPENINIENVIPAGNGFIVKYPHAENVNYIFKPEVINFLKSKDLSAELENDTARVRNIYLTDVPNDIFNKELDEINEEIHKITNTSIIHEGKIQLFGHNFKTELPLEKN